MSTPVSSKSLQRRQFIRLAGGGLVLAAAAAQPSRCRGGERESIGRSSAAQHFRRKLLARECSAPWPAR